MREIGSEFWIDEYSTPIGSNDDIDSNNQKILLSGRTALEYVGRDAGIKSIMLPSYCCHTMIEPFTRNGIKVNFYSVSVDRMEYDFSNVCDAVLLIDFFGYENEEMLKIAMFEHDRGKVVIYDRTHMLMGNEQIERYCDYSIISYRKWVYCNFAVAIKHTGDFIISNNGCVNEKYVSLRNQAAQKKSEYINHTVDKKDEFLALYKQADEQLTKDYVELSGVPTRIDFEKIRSQRRQNAEYLIEQLKNLPRLQLYKKCLGKNDIPLFVPIFLEDAEERNRLRTYLVSRDIYCPIHWPISSWHRIAEKDKKIYERELSLICDQRYDEKDMYRIVSYIRDFLEV